MKIFLESRIIRLRRKPPKHWSVSDLSFEYSSLSQVRDAFIAFEKADKTERLTFWSADNFKTLKADFFSLVRYIKAAGGVVKNEKNEVLVIFRYGQWDLPKGKVKTGPGKNEENKSGEEPEKIPQAALREVMEETGLSKVTITGKLSPTFHIYREKGKQILKKTSWFEMKATSDQPLIPQSEEDISIVKWAGREEIREITESTYPSLKKLFRETFKNYPQRRKE